MYPNSFLSVVAFFLLTCGSALIFFAWPKRLLNPALLEVLAMSLGSVMVLFSGFGLAMVLASYG